MKKKRKLIKRKDFKKIHRGLIPWSRTEFNKVTQEFHGLLQKPKDDWNLKRHQFSILDDETGKVENYQINPFNNSAQFSELMLKKYPDETEFMAHSLRHAEIMMFINDSKEDLIKEGFLIQEEKELLIKEELIESLCVLPFSFKILNEDGEEEFHFSYQEVVDRTWKTIGKKNTDSKEKLE